QVDARKSISLYQALNRAREEELLSSCGSVSRGGLGIALAKMAVAGELGMEVDLGKIPSERIERDDQLLFSESQSRLLITIAPENRKQLETLMEGQKIAYIGRINERRRLAVKGIKGKKIVDADIDSLKEAYKKTLQW
ncbi:MAG: phosphoribosylformylglycinamidine synthase, partial [Deltaproteobacteria bacterium]